ncbi:hypothetical protein BGZ54_003526, partial [Gamsiella multidivaricata]
AARRPQPPKPDASVTSEISITTPLKFRSYNTPLAAGPWPQVILGPTLINCYYKIYFSPPAKSAFIAAAIEAAVRSALLSTAGSMLRGCG